MVMWGSESYLQAEEKFLLGLFGCAGVPRFSQQVLRFSLASLELGMSGLQANLSPGGQGPGSIRHAHPKNT